MSRLLFALPDEEERATALAEMCRAELGAMNLRRFPDGEAYFRLEPEIAGRSVAFVCALDRPDDKLLTLLMAAETARELGARRVGLIAPYLAYMRQDRRFRPGEPVSARLFARLVSQSFDWLVTVDPHLHRIHVLSQLYPIRLGVAAAAPVIARWIAANVAQPLIIGPDDESEQWTAEVAARLGAPHAVMQKERRGDREVSVVAPDLSAFAGRTAVLVDDIVSSGETAIEAISQLKRDGFPPAACVAVHALCPVEVTAALKALGAPLVSVDTVAHPSNAISCLPLLAREADRFL
jgi:ribose-phosphate pyrophosphokinase